ncbi:hypothetical protein MYAM1_003400 [Malassezia yamatoensis]|uniref:Cation efflux protein transmembrane domain-containing protein n=1 Tax=Malassezia yamatoensis TaxID=253288 RepID=A0AAJ6CJD3_9BASI|nr:hypothetical protein MYAM1_003400 [Malassezia yamatoensis]
MSPRKADPNQKDQGLQRSRKSRSGAEFRVQAQEELPESSRSRGSIKQKESRSTNSGHIARQSSEESLSHIQRSNSIRSLQALARLIDHRSGYYEESRKDQEDIDRIPKWDVRQFYEKQNLVLDGWREVDEVLESQFPQEVMRRFVMPPTSQNLPGRTPAVKKSEEVQRSGTNDDDDGYLTDEESDSIWTHPFSHQSKRRQRRISERALTSLSGFFNLEQSALSHSAVSARSELSDLSSPERVSPFGQRMRQSHDACNLQDLAEEGATSPMRGDDQASVSEHTNLMQKGKDSLRKILSTNPAVAGESYGATNEWTTSGPSVSAKKVWTKADRDRNDLLQTVPTHRRKLDTEAMINLYINVNLTINFILVVGKVIAVLSSNSVSLMASLVDSALDLLCTVVIYMTSKASAYRSWHTFYKYPVGKRRLEPLGVLIFSVLMVVSFLQVLLESINRLWVVYKDHSESATGLPWIGIAFMVLTIVIKSIMWAWCKNSENSSVQAIAQDSENDVMFNIFSLIFPMLDKYLGWNVLDPIGGGLLSLYIISEWVSTLADTTSKLTGKIASEVDVSRCLYLVSRFSLVQAISGFELYHAGDTMVAEVDVVLPMSFQLKEAHDLGEIITYCIESLSGIERAYIHLDYNPAGQSGHIGQRG